MWPIWEALTPDVFRYLVLWDQGGYYADLDVTCSQPISTYDAWFFLSFGHCFLVWMWVPLGEGSFHTFCSCLVCLCRYPPAEDCMDTPKPLSCSRTWPFLRINSHISLFVCGRPRSQFPPPRRASSPGRELSGWLRGRASADRIRKG